MACLLESMLSCVQAVTSNVISVLENDLDLSQRNGEEKEESKKTEEERVVINVVENNLADEEVRDEAEEMKAEENIMEASKTYEKTTAKDEVEYVNVIVSPKKSAALVADVAVVNAEEERRTEIEETRPEEVLNVSRIMAE